MKFFKDDTPFVEDYDGIRAELIKLGWIQKIYNVEINSAIYDTTDIGYQYYFAICMELDYDSLFGGLKIAEGQTNAFINESIDLVGEGFLIDGMDAKKMTPKAAEYLYVLVDSQGKSTYEKPKKIDNKTSNNTDNTMIKLGKAFASFTKGMQSMSKMAQQYDKSSTKATRSAWGENTSSSTRNVTSVKRKPRKYKRKTRRKKNQYK
jgi:hypothetical protein